MGLACGGPLLGAYPLRVEETDGRRGELGSDIFGGCVVLGEYPSRDEETEGRRGELGSAAFRPGRC